MEYVIALMTTTDEKEALKIVRHLLKRKLIACANIVNGIRSCFWWEGRIEDCAESLVVMKTSSTHFDEVVENVKSLHSYAVPEVIALHIKDGSQSYLDWLGAVIKSEKG